MNSKNYGVRFSLVLDISVALFTMYVVTSDGPIYESFAFFRVLQSALKMYIAIERNIYISVCLGGV